MKRYDISLDVTPRGTSWAATAQPDGHFVTHEDAQAAIQAAVLAEREACAKLAEPLRLADTIRARSKS